MSLIMRKLEWDMGHKLYKHEGKCARLHGHRYVAEIYCRGPLDSIGRVIDFGKIKELVGGWIDAYWDHITLLYVDDPLAERLGPGDGVNVVGWNPTAENIAAKLLSVATELLKPHEITVERVRVWETPNCWAEERA